MSIQSPTIEELHDAALMVAQLMQKEGCETLAKQHRFADTAKIFRTQPITSSAPQQTKRKASRMTQTSAMQQEIQAAIAPMMKDLEARLRAHMEDVLIDKPEWVSTVDAAKQLGLCEKNNPKSR